MPRPVPLPYASRHDDTDDPDGRFARPRPGDGRATATSPRPAVDDGAAPAAPAGSGAAERLEAWLGQQRVPDAVTLINNAGVVPTPGPLAGAALDELSNALRVGVEAPLLLSAAFLRATAGWGVPRKILNISSGLGRRAMAGSAAYCAAKAGMDHYSRALALEEAAWPDGARVVSLAPGVIDTDMQGQLRGADPALFPERELFARFKEGGLLDSPQRAAAKVLAWLDRPDFGAHPVADVRDA